MLNTQEKSIALEKYLLCATGEILKEYERQMMKEIAAAFNSPAEALTVTVRKTTAVGPSCFLPPEFYTDA